ncbi:MAG: hypothetical protein HRU19_05385 [Pseudobacteriovorax sp.]|nr:hypothetical protein [Pseudobacteriovorax sp.]
MEQKALPDSVVSLTWGTLPVEVGLISRWESMSSEISAFQSSSRRQPRVAALPLTEASTKSEEHPNEWSDAAKRGLLFDGVDDLLLLDNHKDLNIGGPYRAQSIAMSFETGGDVQRMQMLFEKGGSQRGMSLYVSDGRLYFNLYNFPSDQSGFKSSWGPESVSQDVEPNKTYVVIAGFDGDQGRIFLSLNRTLSQVQRPIGYLYDHPNGIGLGAVHSQSVTHTGEVLRGGQYFGGGISSLFLFHHALDRDSLSDIFDQLKNSFEKGP